MSETTEPKPPEVLFILASERLVWDRVFQKLVPIQRFRDADPTEKFLNFFFVSGPEAMKDWGAIDDKDVMIQRYKVRGPVA